MHNFKSIEEILRDELKVRLSFLFKNELDFFNRIYPKGVKEEDLKIAIGLVTRTLDKHPERFINEGGKMKVLETNLISSTPFLNLVGTDYLDNNGDQKTWAWAQRPGGRKAAVIACLVDGKLCVTKEFRVPINGHEWGFPAGLMDEGETPEQTATRELEEETGLEVVSIEDVSPAVLSSVGLTDEAVHIVTVKATGTPNKDKLESSEDIETYLMDRDEVDELMKREDIHIGKTAYSIMRSFVKFGDI